MDIYHPVPQRTKTQAIRSTATPAIMIIRDACLTVGVWAYLMYSTGGAHEQTHAPHI